MENKLKQISLKATKKIYIPSLDGMRAVAFFIVFLSHAGLGHVVPGGFGVTLFFFISGYLITSLLRQEFEITDAINLKYFFIRRILRIWPAFYFVLFVGASLTQLQLLDGEIKYFGFLSQCLHFANYYTIYINAGGVTAGSGIYWSLAVEEHFYLAFPLLYIFLLRMHASPKHQMYFFLGMCLVDLVWRCLLVYGLGVTEYRTYYASDTRFDSLLFGCALAVYGNPVFDLPKLSDRKIKYLFLPIGIVLILFSLLYRNAEFRETFRYTIQGLGLIPIFIAAIRFPHWGIFTILNWKGIRFIGLLSYSLYLVHFTVIKSISMYWKQPHAVLLGLYSFAASFILAYSMYMAIELPFNNLRKKFKVT